MNSSAVRTGAGTSYEGLSSGMQMRENDKNALESARKTERV